MFRVGVIGLGHISATHLENFSDIAGVEVAAIADLDNERVEVCRSEYSVEFATSDYQELLAIDSLDLVVICLPNNLHSQVSIDALNAGHHVLCEKPMATTVKDAEAMIAAAERNQRVLSIVLNFRWQYFGPDIFHLKNLIKNGELGNVYYIRSHYMRRMTFPASGFERWNLSLEESGGGVLIDLGPHMLDLAMWLVDDYSPVKVSGVTHNGILKYSPVDDFASGSVTLRNGTSLQLDLAWNSHNQPSWKIDVYGEKGGAVIDADQPAGQRITRFLAEDKHPITERFDSSDIDPFPDSTLQQHLVSRMIAGEVPDCTAEKSLQVLRVIEGWYQSSKINREVIF